MTTYEEWQAQKQEREAKEQEWKKQREQDTFVSAWIEKERIQQMESNLLCPRCQQGVPEHNVSYFCPQCMLDMQTTIEYSFSGTKPMFRSVKSNKMNDV